MNDYMSGKTIIVTGAGSGFGRLISQKAAARGASIVCGDIDTSAAEETAASIVAKGGRAVGLCADVTRLDELASLVRASLERHGGVDVMVNNAGVMPLAFFADHAAAHAAWLRCIDINIKGVLNGMVAAYDAMMAAGRGQIVNISSIYGNAPVVGAAVYGATKAAVNVLSESFRMETHGRIKVTTIKPTGVPGTGLAGSVVNPDAAIGILGHNAAAFLADYEALNEGKLSAERLDSERIDYLMLAPEHIADAVISVIDQPWGVAISEITVRASGDRFVL